MREYRVGELARAAGTSIRNVRVYQDRGLLAPPRREGRIGLYDEDHLTRLRLIGTLLGRGYTFATIGELFEARGRGRDLVDVLGLGTVPGPGPGPVRMGRAEVSARLGTTPAAATLERAVELGVLLAAGSGYTVPEPAVLTAAGHLLAAGCPASDVFDVVLAARAELSVTAARLLELVTAGAGPLPTPAPHLARMASALLAPAVQGALEGSLEGD